MTPQCANCNETVSESYVRVFAPDGMETVRCCPFCPDLKRTTDPISGGEEIREAHTARRTSGNSGSNPCGHDRRLDWAKAGGDA